MSKNSVAVRAHSRLPAAVKKFWGLPPVDGTEKEEEYWSFAAAIAHDLDPADSIMMLLVKDVVDQAGRSASCEGTRHSSPFWRS